jgi:UDP-N-acetylmuramate--alanine ligase
VTVGPDPPAPPEGAEAVVSTAFAGRVSGKSRADLLAELLSLQDAIVVAGAHGKTTTAAMIAFALDRLGHDPSFLLGGEVGQLGGNARAGSGWLVVEGDESDRTVSALPAKIAVVTNVDLDHHTTFSSVAEVEELLESWLERQSIPVVIRGRELGPADVELALPGEHNRRNAACALAALEAAGVTRADATAALAEFRGVKRRFEFRGERGGVRVYDDYAHHPSEVAATLAAARELAGEGRALVLFQPHLYSRTLHLAHELSASLALADLASITDVYAAREEPLEGVSGKLVVDHLCELRPGMPVGWTPQVEDGARLVAGRARPGDVLLTVGAGDVDSAIPSILERLPP